MVRGRIGRSAVTCPSALPAPWPTTNPVTVITVGIIGTQNAPANTRQAVRIGGADQVDHSASFAACSRTRRPSEVTQR